MRPWSKLFLLTVVIVTGAARADKYCVTCGPSSPTGTKPFLCESTLVGGEAGRVECGVRNPGCQITFYDGRICGPGTYVKSRQSAKAHVKWSISHEGCSVFSGDSRRSAADLRGCYMGKEGHNDEALFQISSLSDAELDELTTESVNEIKSEVIGNFSWVCDHERQGAEIHGMLARNDVGGIRGRYSSFQHHNPNAVNQLAGVPDSYVRLLVQSHCPPRAPETREHQRPDHDHGKDHK